MMDRGWGRVVNITSVSVKSPIPVLGLSNAARAGLTGYVAGTARQVAGKGVTKLELGQVDTEKAAGLARFKLGTGATLRPLGGSWIWWPPLGKLLSPLRLLDRKAMSAG